MSLRGLQAACGGSGGLCSDFQAQDGGPRCRARADGLQRRKHAGRETLLTTLVLFLPINVPTVSCNTWSIKTHACVGPSSLSSAHESQAKAARGDQPWRCWKLQLKVVMQAYVRLLEEEVARAADVQAALQQRLACLPDEAAAQQQQLRRATAVAEAHSATAQQELQLERQRCALQPFTSC